MTSIADQSDLHRLRDDLRRVTAERDTYKYLLDNAVDIAERIEQTVRTYVEETNA